MNQTEQKLMNSRATCKSLGGISKTTLWRYVKQGKLHKPLKPNPKQNFWKPEWLEEFIANMEMAS